MLKSLMLAVACAYINPPGLQPNAPVVEATVPEILKRAHAMEPGTQKKIIIDYVDGLCSKVMIEPSTDEALNAFIDPDAAKNFVVLLPRPHPADAPKVLADCPGSTPDADAECHKAEVAGK
jgi:hypothetical protein